MNRAVAEIPASQITQQTVVLDDDTVHVPAWVVDLASFRRWADLDEFPEKYPRICYLAGEVWIDMSREQIFTHNQVKNEFGFTLTGNTKQGRNGRFFPDVFFTNVDADLNCKPDGIFVSNESFRKKRVQLIEGVSEGYLELEGSPDMVLEVVSNSSVTKDYDVLRELYFLAGVREFWLVNVRKELQFNIYRRTAKGFAAARKSIGWVKSTVFGRSFRLEQSLDDVGNPDYSLTVK